MDEALREHLESRLGDFDWVEVEQGVNDVYILSLDDRDLVLKVQSDLAVDRSTEAEPEIYRIIADEADVPSPEIVYTDFSREQAGDAFYVMEMMHGEKAEEAWPEMSMRDRKEVVCQYGEILGKIHDLRSFTQHGPLRLKQGKLQVRDGKNSWTKALASWFKDWKDNLEDWRNPPEVEVPEETELKGLVPEDPEPVLIHEDNRLDNLVLQGSEISGFLDWSSPISGPRKYDLARAGYLLIDGDTTYAGKEILTDKQKDKLREELVKGYRNTNSIDSSWMDSEERQIYRYAAILNIAADFEEWSNQMEEKDRQKVRKELIDRLKQEETNLKEI
ncbi:MAG: phosphotransferase family protein [Candidatus Nanohalobium sp.]